MKKALSILAALLFTASIAEAQQLSFDAGWQKSQTISTTVASDGYRSYLYAWSDGFYLGASSFYPMVMDGLSFKYSILYSYANCKEADMLKIFSDPHYDAAKEGEVITDEHYISVPGTIDFRYGISDGFSIYAFAGAEVMYCLSSKSYSTWPGLDCTYTWNVDNFGNGTNYNGYRRFDIGILGGIGFEIMDAVRFEFGADYGLLDRSKADERLHRFSLHAGVAYLFK